MDGWDILMEYSTRLLFTDHTKNLQALIVRVEKLERPIVMMEFPRSGTDLNTEAPLLLEQP
jgi:hypothetical protein